jgi:hypothetical protein
MLMQLHALQCTTACTYVSLIHCNHTCTTGGCARCCDAPSPLIDPTLLALLVTDALGEAGGLIAAPVSCALRDRECRLPLLLPVRALVLQLLLPTPAAAAALAVVATLSVELPRL